MMQVLAGTSKEKHGGKLIMWSGEAIPWYFTDRYTPASFNLATGIGIYGLPVMLQLGST